ncbi:MAG TPA: hypothetical protein PKH51_03100 [Candidatus Sumerlaeota bacterium]|nr:hypothetical protein [Candidatus Sumerlaeota bacterium]
MRFDRIRDHRPVRTGFSILDSRIRFGNYFHLMREIVHLHNGWIARVPALDVKTLLGIHVYEDATFVRRIRQHLRDLEVTGTFPSAPGDGLKVVLEALNSYKTWEEYVAAIYSVIKPGLMDAWESHFTAGDPLLNEPSQRLIARFMQITAQHISGGIGLLESLHQLGHDVSSRVQEAGSHMRTLWSRIGNDFGNSPLAVGEKYQPVAKPRLQTPRREDFITVEAQSKPQTFMLGLRECMLEPEEAAFNERARVVLHAQLAEQIVWAEIYAVTSHENPQASWEFHEALSRLVWDKIRHAQAIDKFLGSLGGGWGAQPVDVSHFSAAAALGTKERLAYIAKKHDMDADRAAVMRDRLKDRNQHYLANILDHLTAEADSHRRVCLKLTDHLTPAK